MFEFRLVQTDPNFANYRYDEASGRAGAARLRRHAALRRRAASKPTAACCGPGSAATATEPDGGGQRNRLLPGATSTLDHQRQVLDILRQPASRCATKAPTISAARPWPRACATPACASVGIAASGTRHPLDALFLHRKIGGLYLLAARLKARVDIRADALLRHVRRAGRHAGRGKLMSRMSLVVMLLLALVQGCASRGFPPVTESGIDPQAVALLQRSAERHGLAAWQQLQDVSVAYAGEWGWLGAALFQPELIHAGFRQKSEERLILRKDWLVGQQHEGPQGSKQVVRAAGTISVAYNGVRSSDPTGGGSRCAGRRRLPPFPERPCSISSAAMRCWPWLAAKRWMAGCVTLPIVAVRRPGLGLSAEDRFTLWLDRTDGRLRPACASPWKGWHRLRGRLPRWISSGTAKSTVCCGRCASSNG